MKQHNWEISILEWILKYNFAKCFLQLDVLNLKHLVVQLTRFLEKSNWL